MGYLFLLLGFYVLGSEPSVEEVERRIEWPSVEEVERRIAEWSEPSVEDVERRIAEFAGGPSSRFTWSDSEEHEAWLDALLIPKKPCSLEEQFGVHVGDAVHHVAKSVQVSFMHAMLQEPDVLRALRRSILLVQKDNIDYGKVSYHDLVQMVKKLDFANLHNNSEFFLDILTDKAMYLILSRFNQEDDAAVCAVKKVASAVKGEPLKVSDEVIALSVLHWEFLQNIDPNAGVIDRTAYSFSVGMQEHVKHALSKAMQPMDKNTLRYAITKLWVEGLKAHSQ